MAIHHFFVANRDIVLFVYGQVFFVLGMAIALQSWRHSRLVLARSLPWLAAFGFAHAFHEWGYIFIPIQQRYVAPPLIGALIGAQIALLALSFALLFQFGIEILRPLPGRWRYLRYLPTCLLLLWLWWAFFPALITAPSMPEWQVKTSIAARYALGLPGALVAAYGLRRHTFRLIAPLQSQKVVSMLRLAGIALIGYAILSGLIVARAAFFPANQLNEDAVLLWTSVPAPVFRSILGLTLTIAIIRALSMFQVEIDRRLATLEESQILLAERERIGRDLHDGTLQKIYAVGLLLNSTRAELAEKHATKAGARVQQSIQLLDEAVTDIRKYIGELRPQPDSRSLALGLQELASAGHLGTLLDVKLSLNLPETRPLSPWQVAHVLAIVGEALSNVVRHAQATAVDISARGDEKNLSLCIADNGRGLPPDYVLGYGLQNMHDRAHLLGGTIHVESGTRQGTRVLLEVPWSNLNEQAASSVGR
ncbi:MAG: sensor histidine kinase [Caldilineaceae bacterium]